MRGFCFTARTRSEVVLLAQRIAQRACLAAGEASSELLAYACPPVGRLPSEAMPFRASLAELGCPIVDVDRLTAMQWLDIANGLNSGELISKEELESAVFERVLNAARSVHRMQPRIKSMLFSAL